MGLDQARTAILPADRLLPSAGALHVSVHRQALQRLGSAVQQLLQNWRYVHPTDEHSLLEATPCWRALHQHVLYMVVSLAPVSQLMQQLVAGFHLRLCWWLALLLLRQQALTGEPHPPSGPAVLHAVRWARAQLQQPEH
jgi:hypothetical protein